VKCCIYKRNGDYVTVCANVFQSASRDRLTRSSTYHRKICKVSRKGTTFSNYLKFAVERTPTNTIYQDTAKDVDKLLQYFVEPVDIEEFYKTIDCDLPDIIVL
jgi:hypothetical protein